MELICKTGKYEMKNYDREHLLELSVGSGAKDLIDFIGIDALDSGLSTRGPAFSAFFEGSLFAIGGVNVLWTGTGEAWVMFSSNFEKHGFFIHRTVIRFINRIVDDLKIKRLQAVVMKGHWAGMQWVDRLGFDYEGEMRGYFDGKDFLRYAKIYDNRRT